MLNVLHGLAKNKRFAKMAVIMLIFVLVAGSILPEYRAFAEDDKTETEMTGGLKAGEQVEDEAASTDAAQEAKEEQEEAQEEISAKDQVEDEINKDAAEKEEPKEELDAAEQVEDEEVEDDGTFAAAGEFEAAIEGYEVKVTADDKAFAEEVKLQVKEVLLPGEDEEDAENEEENLQKMTKDTVKVLKENDLYDKKSKAVDLSFVNRAGEKVEPASEVEVELLVDEKLLGKDVEKNYLRLDHVVENKDGEPEEVENLILGTTENENDNKVSYKKKDEKFAFNFKTESFSVYQIKDDPVAIHFVTAVYKEDEEGNEYLYGYNNSLEDQMPYWSNKSYGEIRFYDDPKANGRVKYRPYYQNENGELKSIAVDDSKYKFKAAYIVPRITSKSDWTEGKFGEYIREHGIEISEIKYQNNKWQYWERTPNHEGYRDIPADREYEIFSIYEEKGDNIKPVSKNQVATVDSTSKGLHMYMIDYTGGHNGDWGDSKGLFYINNEYVSSGKRGQTIQGLYSNTINESGYPTLINKSMMINGQGAVTDAQRNMQQWFDPTVAKSNPLVSSIKEANHLFRLSDYENNGYFFYDSALNAAYMPNGNNNNPGNFKVYDNTVTAARNNNYADIFFYRRGMFTPYNDMPTWQNDGWKKIYNDYDASGKKWTDYTDADYAAMYNGQEYKEKVGDHIVYADGARVGANYHFGMYMYCDFFQPVNGQVSHKGNKPEDMVYEFTGDDDMLVYIDGVLVLDLGGIHDAESGKINFRTGTVDYTMNYNNGKDNPVYVNKQTTIKDMFKKAGAEDKAQWDGNTFDAGTAHRIQIFYMERGAAASNLKIKLNIPPVPDGAVALTKAVTKEEGQLAANGATAETPKEYFLMKVQIKKPGGQWEDIPAGTEYTVAGTPWTINKDGYLLLLDRETAIFNFSGDEYTNGNEKTKIRVTEVSSSKLSKEEIENELFSSIGNDKHARKIYDISYWETKAKTGAVVENSNSTEITDLMSGEGAAIDPAKINMITVQNKPASLKISKEVENAIDGDENKEFTFEVKLSDVSLSETKFQALKTRANGSTTNSWINFTKDGSDYKATVKLKKDETLQIFNLPKTATYRVKEDAATGFITEYDNGGESTVVDSNGVSGSLQKSGKAATAEVKVNNRRPAVIKLDSSSEQPVSGGKFAVYELKNVDGTYYRMKKYADNLTADSEGKIILPMDKVPTNKDLFIFETDAPDGYRKAKAPWIIWISPKGRTTMFTHKTPYGPANAPSDWDGRRGVGRGEYANIPYWYTGDFTKVDGSAELLNDRLPVQLEKVDGRDGKTPLEGAEFEVYEAVEKETNKLEKGDYVGNTSPSDDKGKFSFPTSADGYYLMFETKAPKGYYPAKAPWYVVISSDSNGTKVQLWQYPNLLAEGPKWDLGGTDGYQCKTYTKVINYPYETLTKVNRVDASVGNPRRTLAGAEFDLYMAEETNGLYSVDHTGTYAGKKINSDPIVSGSDGKVKLPIPEPGKKYLLFETKAPTGYKKATAPWLVQANANGTLTLYKSSQPDKVIEIVNDENNEIDADSSVVTKNRWWKTAWFKAVGSKDLVNEPKPIELEKYNEDETITLPDAEFMICKVDMSGTDYFVAGTRSTDGAKKDVTVEDKAIKGVDGVDADGKIVRSDTNGKISINGLGEGSYFLFETKAPQGYKRAGSPWLITITETNNEYKWTVKAIDPRFEGKYKSEDQLHDFDGDHLYNTWWNKNGSISGVTNSDWYSGQTSVTKITNEPLYELPNAGGIGVYPFTFVGTILAMIALVLLVAKKKEEVR